MSDEAVSNLKFEIAHVLFIDVIGHSRILITARSVLLRQPTEAVRDTEQFRAAETEGKLARLSTGDGMAFVFSDSPESPVQCALELSKRWLAHPELGVQMSIHNGPVNDGDAAKFK